MCLLLNNYNFFFFFFQDCLELLDEFLKQYSENAIENVTQLSIIPIHNRVHSLLKLLYVLLIVCHTSTNTDIINTLLIAEIVFWKGFKKNASPSASYKPNIHVIRESIDSLSQFAMYFLDIDRYTFIWCIDESTFN